MPSPDGAPPVCSCRQPGVTPPANGRRRCSFSDTWRYEAGYVWRRPARTA